MMWSKDYQLPDSLLCFLLKSEQVMEEKESGPTISNHKIDSINSSSKSDQIPFSIVCDLFGHLHTCIYL